MVMDFEKIYEYNILFVSKKKKIQVSRISILVKSKVKKKIKPMVEIYLSIRNKQIAFVSRKSLNLHKSNNVM